MNKKSKNLLKKHLVFLLVLLLYYIFSKITGFELVCLFHEITGLHCPGCGITRMFRSIGKLDFYQAFRCNQLLFICLPIAIFLYINYIYCIIKGKKSIYEKIPKVVFYIFIVILLLFGILRNIFVELAPIEI